jgi:translocation and assembly module TamB
LRDFSVLEQIIGQSSGPSGGGQVANPLLAGTRLNVTVHSRDGLYIDNELARIQGGMSLTLRGTLAYPSVTGRAEAIEGAIFFRGNRFDLVHASADFIDRNRIIPVLDVRAEADVRSYRLRLDLSGDLEHLRLNISSDPPLSNVDIVSLLTTGKSDQIGVENPRHQAEMTGLSAASILSESLTGVIGKRVERIFGLSSFRIDPFLAGTENDPTARVTITERIAKDLTVTYSRNLTTTQEQIIVIEYDVSKNLSIVATRDEDGRYGVDFRFRKRFR